MGRPRAALDEDLLMAQAGWVRSLAHSIVRDPVRAEDVAQETLMAALKSPPRDIEDEKRLRAWLGRVAFHTAQLIARRTRQQRAREERVARVESQDSTADTLARESVLRVVLDAVRSLEEPYRRTVLLRYFEGLSAGEIARRMGTTDNAVRKRLWRARTELRRNLDARHAGDRSSWFQAFLAPLSLRGPSGPAGAGAGAPGSAGAPLLLAAKVLGAAAAALAVTLGARAATRGPSTPPVTPVDVVVQSPSLDPGRELRSAPELPSDLPRAIGRVASRAAAPPPPIVEPLPEPAGASAPAPPVAPVPGRVVDERGAPVGGLLLEVAEEGAAFRALAQADPEGRFDLSALAAGTAGQAELRARGAGWTPLTAIELEEGAPAAGDPRERLLAVAPGLELAGLVLDAAGAPAADVEVRLELPGDFLAELEGSRLLGSRPVERTARTTPDGRFLLEGWPAGRGIALAFERPDLGRLVVPMPDHDDFDLRVAFGEDAREHGLRLTGRVLGARGQALAGARITLGDRRAVADERGTFSLAMDLHDPDALLVVEHEGHRTRVVHDLGRRTAGLARPLDLRLEEAPPGDEVRGQVLAPLGVELSGWQVVLVDPPPRGGLPAIRPLGPVSDDRGRFRLRTSEPPERLAVLSPEGLLVAARPAGAPTAGGERPGGTPGGAQPGGLGGELEFPVPDDPWSAVAGQLVAPSGAALAGVEVAVTMRVDGIRRVGAHLRTDAAGSFRLERVPRSGAELRFRHPSGSVTYVPVGPGLPGLPEHLVLAAAAYVRVEGAGEAERFALRDGSGRELELEGFRESGARGSLTSGASGVFAVPAAASELVLLVADEPVLTVPVSLAAGGTAVLRP